MDKVNSFISNPFYYLVPIPLSNPEKIDLANKHWSQLNENLWIGSIHKHHFTFDGADHLDIILKDFFQFKYYTFDIETIEVNEGTVQTVEQTCKAVYLLNQWLKKKSFRDPICTHYNPRLGVNVVHPGGTRQIILDLFQTDPIKTFYFNTGGVRFDFLDRMQKISLESVIKDNFYASLVPDHGTLIPHILNLTGGVSQLPANMIAAHNYYKDKLSNPNYKIFANDKIPYLTKWCIEDASQASVIVTFKNRVPSHNSKLKAILLILSGSDYNDSELHVAHRKSVVC